MRSVCLDFSTPSANVTSIACGTAFVDGRRFANDELLEAVPHRRREVSRFLTKLNGFFSMAGRIGDHFVAAVDRVRSRPIFFAEHDGALHVSDDAYILANLWSGPKPAKPEPEISAEFLMSGFVTGRDTLDPNVHQLAAGEFLWAERVADGYSYDIEPYFEYRSTENINTHREPQDWMALLDQVATGAVERLTRVAHGRPIALPLSGGRDSRLIAIKLKQLGYRDVYCYSYGSLEGWEARTSRGIAERLGYPWFFVSYSPDLWRGCRIDASFSAFRERAHSLSEIECVQEWPAVLELSGRVPSDSLFAPGHTLDFLAGSHLPKSWERDDDGGWHSLEAAILRRHFSLWRRDALTDVFGSSSAESLRDALLERVRRSVARFETPGVAGRVQAIEYFGWIERQAKFIVNSVRVYEAHGYDWWLPWWDSDLIEFWASVPLPLRFGQRLRNQYVDALQSTVGIKEIPRPEAAHRRRSWSLLRDAGRFRSARPVWHGLRGDGHWSALGDNPLSWYSLVEPEIAAWGYSGVEHVNAYLSRRYVQRP